MLNGFEERKEALLKECEVSRSVFRGMEGRLERFVNPYVDLLLRKEQKEHTLTYLSGLMSDLERKNSESIAYRHDLDRLQIQRFIGSSSWDHNPFLDLLATQVGERLGEPDGILVFDPSAHPKKGTHSVGVARQWCGRMGKVENCQVGIYMGYVSSKEHALVDVRLYLPKDRANDHIHREQCHIPKDVRYQTRHSHALEMLASKGRLLPHKWITGDDEMGRSSRFRSDLRDLNETYLLAVPSNTLIRDLDADPPAYSGRGQPPKRRFVRVDRWREKVPEDAWTQIDVRDGERGPLIVDIVACRVAARDDQRRQGPEETLVVIRRRDEAGGIEHDYYLSNAPASTPLQEFARVAKAEHRIEETLKRAKGEAGLSDYEVRSWHGWYHHQTLSLMATWFLTQEALRGKKMDTSHYRRANPCGHRTDLARCFRVRSSCTHRTRSRTPNSAHTAGQAVPLCES